MVKVTDKIKAEEAAMETPDMEKKDVWYEEKVSFIYLR